MAKLYFYYAAMNAGKTTTLLQSAHNYSERGMRVLIFTPKLDFRAGSGTGASRIGLSAEGQAFERDDGRRWLSVQYRGSRKRRTPDKLRNSHRKWTVATPERPHSCDRPVRVVIILRFRAPLWTACTAARAPGSRRTRRPRDR